MNLCSTCKHWLRGPDLKDEEHPFTPGMEAKGFGKCGAVIHDPAGYIGWDDEDLTARMPTDEAGLVLTSNKVSAVVLDGSGYYAALVTRGDFGCVLHEAKPPTPELRPVPPPRPPRPDA